MKINTVLKNTHKECNHATKKEQGKNIRAVLYSSRATSAASAEHFAERGILRRNFVGGRQKT